MKVFKIVVLIAGLSVVLLSGCGGGGGGGTAAPPTTKTATLKFASQSTNSGDLIGGFLLTAILPVGSVLPVGSSGDPLSSAVYLSGQFAGAPPQVYTSTYESVSRKLTVSFASINEYHLGEFITIIVTVPSSYVPNTSDITYSFTAWNPAGNPLAAVTAAPTFI